MIGHEIDGRSYAEMIGVAAKNLNRYVNVVNDLNVFPIPDGDTGDNMMMTLKGGADVSVDDAASLSDAAEKVAKGMLLNARGNSGVILSQFFAGIADGFEGLDRADIKAVEDAFRQGVKRAYDAVMVPTEGTILTVAKEATLAACNAQCEDPEGFMGCFVDGAKESLERTPDLLKVLKEAGVVDSGGAGLVYIAEGMLNYLTGEYDETDIALEKVEDGHKNSVTDLEAFGPDSVLEFGYCTETLLRLQSSKCDYENFDVNTIRDFLQTIGNSIVCIKDGSIVKIHVHTLTPQKVLEFCQQYGEFLTVKIENMMLQHNNLETGAAANTDKDATPKPRTKYGVVAVASGEGIKDDFISFGVDEVICGGQTMNPSAENFIQSFDRINADDIFVLPNNGNIILAANQAAKLYEKSNIHVIPTHSIGDAYAILGMLDYEGTPEDIVANMEASMEGVETAEVSKSIRDASLNGVDIREGEYIGILKKEVVTSTPSLVDAAKATVDRFSLDSHSILLIIRGKGATEAESSEIAEYAKKKSPYIEVVETEGKQDVYPFLIVGE